MNKSADYAKMQSNYNCQSLSSYTIFSVHFIRKEKFMSNYRSIQKKIIFENEIKKSRFITYLIPIKTEEEFEENLELIRKEHYKATHHCQAYILGEDSMIQRMSDDGEPSGTAGVPMLEVLKREELTFVMAVVVRYFGGVKLGAGGLIRAYSSAVSDALKEAVLIENVPQAIVRLTLEYPQVDSFNYFIEQIKKPPQILDTQYTDKVTHQLAVNLNRVEEIESDLTERFSGQIEWEVIGEQAVDIPIQ